MTSEKVMGAAELETEEGQKKLIFYSASIYRASTKSHILSETVEENTVKEE